MLKKLDNIIFLGMNLGILVFLFRVALVDPSHPVSLLIFLIATFVGLYSIFEIIWRINNLFVERDIKRYINSGFDPRNIKRYS